MIVDKLILIIQLNYFRITIIASISSKPIVHRTITLNAQR